MCSDGQRYTSLSKCENLSFVTLCSRLLWTVREYLRMESVHFVIMVTALWKIRNICLSVSENFFFPVNQRIKKIEFNFKIFFRNTMYIKNKILSFFIVLILRMLSSSFYSLFTLKTTFLQLHI